MVAMSEGLMGVANTSRSASPGARGPTSSSATWMESCGAPNFVNRAAFMLALQS